MRVRISPPAQKLNMLKIITFLQNAYQEVRYKVTWPTQEELQNAVRIFIISTFICAVLVSSINALFKNIMDFFYNKL